MANDKLSSSACPELTALCLLIKYGSVKRETPHNTVFLLSRFAGRYTISGLLQM